MELQRCFQICFIYAFANILASCASSPANTGASPAAQPRVPNFKHVFLIVLENRLKTWVPQILA